MNNREFYNKWGNTETLKVLINSIIVAGMESFSEINGKLAMDASDYHIFGVIPEPMDLIDMAECYRDFMAMPDGFKKNVIKKVL